MRHGPQLVHIEAEVLTHQDVPRRDDFRPWNFGMAVSDGLGQAAGGFSDHLQVVDHPDLEHLVLLKDINVICDPRLDFRDGLQDVA